MTEQFGQPFAEFFQTHACKFMGYTQCTLIIIVASTKSMKNWLTWNHFTATWEKTFLWIVLEGVQLNSQHLSWVKRRMQRLYQISLTSLRHTCIRTMATQSEVWTQDGLSRLFLLLFLHQTHYTLWHGPHVLYLQVKPVEDSIRQKLATELEVCAEETKNEGYLRSCQMYCLSDFVDFQWGGIVLYQIFTLPDGLPAATFIVSRFCSKNLPASCDLPYKDKFQNN